MFENYTEKKTVLLRFTSILSGSKMNFFENQMSNQNLLRNWLTISVLFQKLGWKKLKLSWSNPIFTTFLYVFLFFTRQFTVLSVLYGYFDQYFRSTASFYLKWKSMFGCNDQNSCFNSMNMWKKPIFADSPIVFARFHN